MRAGHTSDDRQRGDAEAPARRAAWVSRLGDLHAAIDDNPYTLETLLDWATRDEREGAEEPPPPDD